MTKQRLYYQVERIRKDNGVNYPPPYDAKKLCTSNFRLYLNVIELKTPNLRGMSHIPSHSIIIDSKRLENEQNFYCMHEIMHHTLHRNRPTKLYSCYEETQADQDSFIEWEANEGAAQFLVPYQDFIPRIKRNFLDEYYVPFHEIVELAEHYNVSNKVIENRLRSLSYEIYQYRNRVPIDSLEILSKNQLRSMNIDIPCYSCYLRPTHYTSIPSEFMKYFSRK